MRGPRDPANMRPAPAALRPRGHRQRLARSRRLRRTCSNHSANIPTARPTMRARGGLGPTGSGQRLLRATSEPARLDRDARRPPRVLGGLRLPVARGGVEPPTYRFSVGRSYQLSYLAGRGERLPDVRGVPRIGLVRSLGLPLFLLAARTARSPDAPGVGDGVRRHTRLTPAWSPLRLAAQDPALSRR